MHDLTYAILFLATTAYALYLEQRRRDPERTYAPRWTWVTVAVGCSIVGAFATVRCWLGAPEWIPLNLWLVWASVVWWGHFLAGGLPIVVWQEIVDRRNLKDALDIALSED